MRTYKKTLEYLDTFVNYEKKTLSGREKFDLKYLRAVLKKIRNPEKSYYAIHVAGTKGKGSICAFISCILKEAGYKVGFFTSPHLVSAEERIKFKNRNIGKSEIVYVVDYLRKRIEPRALKKLTYFEMFTLIAMVYFKMKGADFAVFETGMGGRLDATNVIDAKLCGFSPISYDHTHVLGKKITQIAREKAGIIKNKAYCVSSGQLKGVMCVIKQKCAEKSAELSIVGRDITYEIKRCDRRGTIFDVYGRNSIYRSCRLTMLGEFQASNCAAAIGICEKALENKGGLSLEAVKKGAERAFLPGRLEILRNEPILIIDGAQNKASAACLKDAIKQIFRYRKLILLLGISRDKDIKGVCCELVPFADEIILTRASVKRAASPYLIKGYIKDKKVKITQNVKEALSLSFSIAHKNDLILATGSFYVIGEVRQILTRLKRETRN